MPLTWLGHRLSNAGKAPDGWLIPSCRVSDQRCQNILKYRVPLLAARWMHPYCDTKDHCNGKSTSFHILVLNDFLLLVRSMQSYVCVHCAIVCVCVFRLTNHERSRRHKLNVSVLQATLLQQELEMLNLVCAQVLLCVLSKCANYSGHTHWLQCPWKYLSARIFVLMFT